MRKNKVSKSELLQTQVALYIRQAIMDVIYAAKLTRFSLVDNKVTVDLNAMCESPTIRHNLTISVADTYDKLIVSLHGTDSSTSGVKPVVFKVGITDNGISIPYLITACTRTAFGKLSNEDLVSISEGLACGTGGYSFPGVTSQFNEESWYIDTLSVMESINDMYGEEIFYVFDPLHNSNNTTEENE